MGFSRILGLFLFLVIVTGVIVSMGVVGAPGKGNFSVSSVHGERDSKTLTQTEILCFDSPCMIERETCVYYYHTEHLAYDSYYGCGSDFVCQTPIYDLAVNCLDLYDVYNFTIGFDAMPGFTFRDLNIYIDDQDVYFDTTDWEWYRFWEDDSKLFAVLAAEGASLEWDFYLTEYGPVDDYLLFPPEKYLPNPDISCYFDCYQIYEEPYCYCNNSDYLACDAYGDLYSYLIDFEDAVGDGSYWSIKNVYLYLLHDSDLYETSLIRFSNISQVESAKLVFDVSGSNPDELYEQGNLYVEVYNSSDNLLGTILDELITSSVTKNTDILGFLRDEGIKFLFGNDFGSYYVIENLRIEFVARCSDGTVYGECSVPKPLYCSDGNLINNCHVCGCEECYACQPDGTCIVWDFQGDVNGDRKVDIFDLAAVGLCYGQPVEGECEKADIHPHPKGNGMINIFDLATVGLNYGQECV